MHTCSVATLEPSPRELKWGGGTLQVCRVIHLIISPSIRNILNFTFISFSSDNEDFPEIQNIFPLVLKSSLFP